MIFSCLVWWRRLNLLTVSVFFITTTFLYFLITSRFTHSGQVILTGCFTPAGYWFLSLTGWRSWRLKLWNSLRIDAFLFILTNKELNGFAKSVFEGKLVTLLDFLLDCGRTLGLFVALWMPLALEVLAFLVGGGRAAVIGAIMTTKIKLVKSNNPRLKQ